MLLQASENESAGVEANVKGALEAAHEAIWSFFKLWGLFEAEAGVWWVFQHRAFEESLLMAHLLATPVVAAPTAEEATDEMPPPAAAAAAAGGLVEHPIYDKAKDDILRMMEIMERYGGALAMHRARKDVLQEAFERISV